MNLIEELMSVMGDRDVFSNRHEWQTLDVDYYPPRVERVWRKLSDTRRLFVHLIHPTDQPCLLHKHRWPAAFAMLSGAYETALTRCEEEIDTDAARSLPVVSRHIVSAGSFYEMTDTHALHYVRPLGDRPSLSLMLTGPLYPEASYRQEAPHPELKQLTQERADQILDMARIAQVLLASQIQTLKLQ